MKPIKRLDDLIAWQLARKLERLVSAFIATAPAKTDFDFCRQIARSSSSAPRNMAEGFGRFWPGEFAHRVRIGIGELEETLDHLDKALESNYITEEQHLEMYGLGNRAAGAAVRFVQYLDAAGPGWKKEYLARRRERYRAQRAKRHSAFNAGTSDPARNSGNSELPNQNPQDRKS
jgi:four helix bundle protein